MGNDRDFLETLFEVWACLSHLVPPKHIDKDSKHNKVQMIWHASVQCVGYMPGVVVTPRLATNSSKTRVKKIMTVF